MGSCLSVLRNLVSKFLACLAHDPQRPAVSATSPGCAGQEQAEEKTAGACNQPQDVPALPISTDTNEEMGVPEHDLSPVSAGQEQCKEEPTGACGQPQPASSSSGATDKGEEIDVNIAQHTGQPPAISNPYPGCACQEQGAEEVPGVSGQPHHVPSGSAAENDEVVITAILATDVALGLRRIPAGFYVALYHNGFEWRTENKPSSVNNDVIEWNGPIPISSDLSANIRLEVYASFEFQPMLGDGEHLRTLTATVEQLLDHSGSDAPFTFFPKDGDVVSPCSSISVTVQRRKRENSDASGSRVVGPQWSTPEPRGEIENATNQGHSALERYRRHGEKPDLERSIQQFERALNICPRDNPRRAAAESNLAMAKLIQSQVEGTDAPLGVALSLYRDALAARPAGHPDRPLTLIQLALAHSTRFQRARNHVDETNAEGLLREAMELSNMESHEKRAAAVLLHSCTGHREGHAESDGHSSMEQDSTAGLMDENPRDLSVQLLERFNQFGNLEDLHRAISILERLVKSTSTRDRSYCVTLGNLGVAQLNRFLRLGQIRDLEDAISTQREVIRLTPDGHPNKPLRLGNLGDSFRTHFKCRGQLSDLKDAILAHREAVRLTPDGHPNKPKCLGNLGNSLATRFLRLGALSDLEDAISNLREAVGLTPDGHLDQPGYLNDLGNSFQARFLRLGELSDLEDAISTRRKAVHLSLDGHPYKPTYLNNLGNSFYARFERLGELSDLTDAISTLREAIRLTPDGHPDKPMCLDNLGRSFRARFERLGEPSDIEVAISTAREAVSLTPDDHPNKPEYLNGLGDCFHVRFERLGELSDLKEVISTMREAVDLAPNGHPRKPEYLHGLGSSLRARFSRLGELSDIEDAISTLREAVHLTPDDHPNKLGRLGNLGISYHARFSRLGELSDLEDAISALREAASLTSDSDPNKPVRLSNLGISFQTRFFRLGELTDLEDAILALREADRLTPDGHPDKPRCLSNLGNSFETRFSRVGEPKDLKEAISTLSKAVRLTPDGHPEKSGRLSNLGNSFAARFERFGELGDLEDAISMKREAVCLTPDGHPDKPIRLNSLGTFFLTHFKRLGKLSDLKDAISTKREAIRLTPHDHLWKPVIMNSLAQSLVTHFLRFRRVAVIEYALSLSSYVASIPVGIPSVRFSAAQLWIQCARLIHHTSLLHAYSVAVSLVPKLAWIGLPLSHRYDELIPSADIVREAAAAALVAGFPERALEWLEQGRSVVWGELFQLRSSYDELSSAHPDYASRLHALSTQLDQASAARERSLSTMSEQSRSVAHQPPESLRRVADKHRALAIERDKLLQDIRRLPGFEKFLLRKPFSQLRAAAHSGPVVILNAAETRCDALIVVPNLNHVIHVPLPALTLERSVRLQSMMGFVRDARVGGQGERIGTSWKTILYPLWKSIVKPVLNALAIQSTPVEPSRIFWCPTGPLAFLPIHAAGDYDEQYSEPGHKIFDFVVSSYVPTLSTLLRPSNPNPGPPNSPLRLLLVPQPHSDGLLKLRSVALELQHIDDVVDNSPLACTTFRSSAGTVEEVLDLMKQADWVHFACHGVQDGVDSGLCLADGRRLRLRDIVALSRPHGGLAFLSACHTAKGDRVLPDEAIHIAAGMLFAGYGGVVGTMWTINDSLAPRVGKKVYEELLRKGPRADYRGAARALHEATKDLRTDGVSFDKWIPFIHVGL